MGDWISVTEFGLTGLLILAIVYVATTYIKTVKNRPPMKESEHTHASTKCQDSLQGVLADNTKVISELVFLFRQQHETDKEWIRSNQEVLNGLVIALNNVIAISKEILDRVKDIDRRK